jgi:hypothetical protein
MIGARAIRNLLNLDVHGIMTNRSDKVNEELHEITF